MRIPSGTVTFLFSDIEGSTKLAQQLGERWADVLLRHRSILRDVWKRHDGIELGTEGDSFFVVFERAADGVRAATEGQRALADGPVSVRIGLHTGEPLVVDGDYIGVDVHLAARVASAAQGGQVLLSERTRSLAPAEIAVKDLGLHVLKDFHAPQRLFQAGDGDFAPPRTRKVSNLPVWESPIVGREREIDELADLCRRRRLVTITGPGGIGKTRLAAAVAAAASDAFADGTSWVSLSSVTDPVLALPAIAASIGARDDLAGHLADKNLLIAIDNLEHVIDAATGLSDLLAACPGLHLLVTSRAALRVRDESEFALDPLDERAAAELFAEQAAESTPHDTVIEICRRLDCLPLAVELAAARTRVFTPAQLLERLDDALPVLTSRRRDAPARQRTLDGAIEWSYRLLSPEGREAFVKLAVFADPFDVDDAAVVCGVSDDALEELFEHSLLRRAGERVAMLRTIREFAAARLHTSEPALEIADAHAHFFAAVVEEADDGLNGPGAGDAIARIARSLGDVYAAIRRLVASGQGPRAAHLCGTLRSFWSATARFTDAKQVTKGVLNAAWPGDALRAELLSASAWYLMITNEPAERVMPIREEAVALARASGDRAVLANVLRSVFASLEDLSESLRIAREIGDSVVEMNALHLLGELHRDEGRFDDGAAALDEAIRLAAERDSKLAVATSRHSLGDLEVDRGNLDAADGQYRLCMEAAIEHDFARHKVYCLAGFAATAALRGDDDRAVILWRAVARAEKDLDFRLFDDERNRYETILNGLDTSSSPELAVDEACAFALR